ncbi:hypothetical protein [Erythrobacter mangrovi]|uniref:Uncharacterized protein n=1 Tax=Erythrobacter mangrovi TaxID=2739433 RepID=A0A7D4AV25_9SPHN|nr:hypothetical protein [Erythrobacter mangrovi]QKG72377.1 hypothetical protein HQR01_13945 [Erythrobacter mangrovi]
MNFLKYLGLLFNRAAQKSVLLTDRLTILIVPFATLALWMAGAEMTDSVQETLFLGVAMTVLAVVVLRLVAASYFVWKEDQDEKEALVGEIERPERLLRADLRQFSLDNRKALSVALAKLSAIANLKTEPMLQAGYSADQINKLVVEIDTLINQLSYDYRVRVAALHFRDYCIDLISGERDGRDTLWERRKLVFKLLHKEDHVNDDLTLVELAIVIEDEDGECNFASKGVLAELKEQIRELGGEYYNREVRDDLRRKLKDNQS